METSWDMIEPVESLRHKAIRVTKELTYTNGGPVLLRDILAAMDPVVGYARDDRDAALAVVVAVKWTSNGDALYQVREGKRKKA